VLAGGVARGGGGQTSTAQPRAGVPGVRRQHRGQPSPAAFPPPRESGWSPVTPSHARRERQGEGLAEAPKVSSKCPSHQAHRLGAGPFPKKPLSSLERRGSAPRSPREASRKLRSGALSRETFAAPGARGGGVGGPAEPRPPEPAVPCPRCPGSARGGSARARPPPAPRRPGHCPGEASSAVLGPVLGSPVQER